MVGGHHFDEVVAIGIALQEVFECLFARLLLTFNPAEVAGLVVELSHVDHKIGIGIEQIAPLGLIESFGFGGAGHGVAVVIGPARDHAAIGVDGMIAVIVEALLVSFQILGIVDGDAHLADVLLVQANRAIRRVPAVAAEEFRVDHPDAGDGVQQPGNLTPIQAGELAAVGFFPVIEPGESDRLCLGAGRNDQRSPNIGFFSDEPSAAGIGVVSIYSFLIREGHRPKQRVILRPAEF